MRTSGSIALAALCLLAVARRVVGQERDPIPVLDSVYYSLEIDCSRRGILNEGTRSHYTIVGISEDGGEVSLTPDPEDMQRLTERDCLAGVAPFAPAGGLPGSTRIRRIQIALIGQYSDDALFLDSLQLSMIGPDVEDSIGWGADGGEGWCLSVDAGDSRTDWRRSVYDDVCYPCMEFSIVPLLPDESPVVDGEWRRTAAPGYAECLPAESSPSLATGDE